MQLNPAREQESKSSAPGLMKCKKVPGGVG